MGTKEFFHQFIMLKKPLDSDMSKQYNIPSDKYSKERSGPRENCTGTLVNKQKSPARKRFSKPNPIPTINKNKETGKG